MIFRIKKSQAITEMAIFGTLVLLIFYYLLSYTQRMNESQRAVQEAFRNALRKAKEVGGAASYVVLSARKKVSIYTPLRGEANSASGSGSVLWGKGDDSKTYYKFNQDEVDLTDLFDSDTDPDDDYSIVDETDITTDVDANDFTEITYSSGSIVSTQRSRIKDEITYTLKDSDGSAVYTITQGVNSDGEYSTSNVGDYVDLPERRWMTTK